ncbi:DUF3575 domain-containing protein [uncultured Bacteroides sp.]|uniref:DUF3575 domain-containing protein n=1 Tax=uncultured Bacteroides sp. TaxID=162156 RepID=UPI002591331C|nr:DUF3575 domain-containing protein [uncultured Bacteroides sp.]
MKTDFRYLLFLILALTFHSRIVSANIEDNVPNSKDSVIIFRFIPKDLMFYDSKKLGFRESLFRALDLINSHKDDIVAGKAVVVIHGYCTSFPTYKANRAAAKNRSNQVKSYFITNYWMKEQYYKTRNHVDTYRGNKEIVAVVGIEYLPGYEPKREAPKFEPIISQASIPVPSAYFEKESIDILPKEAPVEISTLKEEDEDTRSFNFPFILKSNLIYDAMLAPSLEIEYVINDRWSAGVETSIAWWHNNNKPWFYQIATLIPEVRYRIDARKQGHYHSIGLFGGAGWYDLEYKKTGYQGELWMAGLSYSYSFPINKLLGFEAGAGLGFMSAKYEEYLPQDGHFAYQQTTRTNFFGPLRLKFALVFDFNRWLKTKKGGER